MAEENNKINEQEVKEPVASAKSKSKTVEKKPNFFVRAWNKIVKFVKDVAGEMKKVVWTPKDELKKSTKLVLVTVVAIGAAIAIVDFCFSFVINSIAGLIG